MPVRRLTVSAVSHSFPTRRSSDLGGDPAGRVAVHRRVAVAAHRDDEPLDLHLGRGLAHDRLGAPDDIERLVRRKSTRLNSSHGYITYAVFCMQKKSKKWMYAYRRH